MERCRLVLDRKTLPPFSKARTDKASSRRTRHARVSAPHPGMTELVDTAWPSSNRSSSSGRRRAAVCGSGPTLICASLLLLMATRASAQTSDPPPDAGGARVDTPGNVVATQPSGTAQPGVTFDVTDIHAFDGEVKGTSGSSMSSTSLHARLALRAPI